MKYADYVKNTPHDPGGSKKLTGMLLNQINGLKFLQLTSSQCSGHHVQLQSQYIQHVVIHCWCPILPHPRPK